MNKQIDNNILMLNENEFTFYVINESNLTNKTTEIILKYIYKHYEGKVSIINNKYKIMVFRKKDIDQDLIDILYDLSINPITKEELQKTSSF